MTLHGCIYCADNVNDSTVYVQVNCKGNYFKGIKNPSSGAPVTPPPTKKLKSVSGDLGTSNSQLGFTSEDAFDLNIAMEDFGDGMKINGEKLSYWNANNVNSFAAGSTVSLDGPNGHIADVLYWGFGNGVIKATSTTNDAIVMQIGFDKMFGMVAIPFKNSVVQDDQMDYLPWR